MFPSHFRTDISYSPKMFKQRRSSFATVIQHERMMRNKTFGHGAVCPVFRSRTVHHKAGGLAQRGTCPQVSQSQGRSQASNAASLANVVCNCDVALVAAVHKSQHGTIDQRLGPDLLGGQAIWFARETDRQRPGGEWRGLQYDTERHMGERSSVPERHTERYLQWQKRT